MFPKLTWRDSFNNVTFESLFLSTNIYRVLAMYVGHWDRKWGLGSKQAQRDCCPNGVGNDAVVIKLPKTLAPESEGSEKVRQN